MRKARNLREALRALSDSDLLLLLERSDPDLEHKICFEMGRRHMRIALEPLRKRLSSLNPRVRETAAEALGMLGDHSAGADLLALFSDWGQPVPVRDTCAYALARLAYRPALPRLLSALADVNPTVRICSLAALAEIGDAEISERVQDARSTEQNPKVLKAFDSALAEIAPRRQSRQKTRRAAMLQPRFSASQMIPEQIVHRFFSYSGRYSERIPIIGGETSGAQKWPTETIEQIQPDLPLKPPLSAVPSAHSTLYFFGRHPEDRAASQPDPGFNGAEYFTELVRPAALHEVEAEG
jgi:HEAT repeat protein